MIYLLFISYFFISQALRSLCQASSGITIQKKTYPNGTQIYYYNGRPYNNQDEILNEIQSQNPGYRLVFQQSPSGGASGNSISHGNNEVNTNYRHSNPYQYGGYNGLNSNNRNNNPYLSSQNGGYYGNNMYNGHYPSNENGNSLINKPNSNSNLPGNKIDENIYGKPSLGNPNELNFNYKGINDIYGRHSYSDGVNKRIWAEYDINSDKFRQFQVLKIGFMKESNEYRRKHGASPLQLDPDLEQKAQTYAEYLARIGKLEHDLTSNKIYKTGENLGYASGPVAHIIVKKWYDESLGYDYSKNYAQPGKGHFTQLVWLSSQRAGFGIAADINGGIYVVCRYLPAGNIYGLYISNVNRPKY